MAVATGAGATYSSDLADLDDYSVRKAVEMTLYVEYGRAHIMGDGAVPGLSSTDGDSIVHVKEELVNGPGQTIGFSLLRNLGGPGVQDDVELENNEDNLSTADCRIKIGQQRKGVKSGGRVTRQTLSWNFVKKATKLLSKHARTVDEIWFFTQACNYDADASATYYYDDGAVDIDPTKEIWTGLNPTKPVDDDHIVYCSADNTTEATLDSGDFLDREYVLEAVNRAEQLLNPLRPVNIGGEDVFVLWVHNNVMNRLQQSDTKWYDLMKANLQGSNAKEAWRAFGGRLRGRFENVLIAVTPYVTPCVTGGTDGAPINHTYRNVLTGAQTIGKAYGKETPNQSKMGLIHGDRDHKNIAYLSYYRLCGMQVTQFKDRNGTARNHGNILLVSYATRPTISS